MSELKTEINILDRIQGTKKKMYLSILQFLAEGFTEEETALIVSRVFSCHLTHPRINQIKKINRDLLDEMTLKAELSTQAGRLRKAFRVLRRKSYFTTKDSLDWLEYVRKELVGEKGVDVKVGVNITNKVGSNGSFTGEDRELQNRIRRDIFGDVPKE